MTRSDLDGMVEELLHEAYTPPRMRAQARPGMRAVLERHFHVLVEPQPVPSVERTPESAWLIERGQAMNHSPTIWWKGGDSRPINEWPDCWTTNASQARRFKAKHEAVWLAEELFEFGTRRASVTVTEHVFLDREPAEASRKVRGHATTDEPSAYDLNAIADRRKR